MAGALPRFKQGPATYTAGGLILGGQLVVPASGLGGALAALNGVGVLVCPAGYSTGTTNGFPLGVAGADANTGMFASYNTTYGPIDGPSLPVGWPGDGSLTTQDQLLDSSILGYSVPVYNNVDIPVNYDGACVFGQNITWSATVAGAVTSYTGTDPKVIVGKCTQPGGVTVAGVARAFIRV